MSWVETSVNEDVLFDAHEVIVMALRELANKSMRIDVAMQARELADKVSQEHKGVPDVV